MIAHPDRNSKGRFVAGNQSAAGHKKPLARRMNDLRRAAAAEMTTTKIRLLMNKMWSAGLGGDVSAAEFCMRWTLGKPTDPEMNDRLQSLEQTAGLKTATPDDEPEPELPAPMYEPVVDDLGKIVSMKYQGEGGFSDE